MGKRTISSGRRSAGVLGVLVLAAGVAWAAQSMQAPIPSNPVWSATATIVPGNSGDGAVTAEGASEKIPEDSVDLRNVFGSDGYIYVNDQQGPAYVGNHAYRVMVTCWPANGHRFANVVITDLTMQTPVHSVQNLCVDGDGGDGMIRASGVEVLSLDVN